MTNTTRTLDDRIATALSNVKDLRLLKDHLADHLNQAKVDYNTAYGDYQSLVDIKAQQIEDTARREADVLVRDCGTLWTFQPVTEAAREFFNHNVETEGWQWIGGKLGIDHRPARDFLAHLTHGSPLAVHTI